MNLHLKVGGENPPHFTYLCVSSITKKFILTFFLVFLIFNVKV